MIEIKDRFTARVIYSSDKATTVKEALLEAIQQRADLSGADLSGADLSGADLSGADLSRAYLSGANLSGADLSGANLSGADLSGADLSRADLSGANLSGADLSGADLSGANLSGADLSNTNLSRADLSRAYLSGANLSGADLSGADLSGANLSNTNLSRADLSRAIGYNRYLTEPLLSLYDQPSQIVMYKLVTADGTGPIYPGIQYEIGKTIRVAKKLVETNDEIDCGAGVNVATLPWVLQHWTKGQRVLTVSFTANDIASIPINSDGKLRLFKCKVEAELDLVAMNFIDADGNRI